MTFHYNVTLMANSVTPRANSVTKSLFDRLDQVTRHMAPDHIWTVKMVGDWLIAAVRLLERIGGPVLPSEQTGFWPPIEIDWTDLLAQAETEEMPEGTQLHYRATTKEVSRMEAAIGWQARYLSSRRYDGVRRVLAVWLRSKARRRGSFAAAVRRKGWSRATAYQGKDRALLIIAIGLMEDGVLPT